MRFITSLLTLASFSEASITSPPLILARAMQQKGVYVDLESVVEEIRREIPSSEVISMELEILKNFILEGTTVPLWFHNIVTKYTTSQSVDFDHPPMIAEIMAYAPRGSPLRVKSVAEGYAKTWMIYCTFMRFRWPVPENQFCYPRSDMTVTLSDMQMTNFLIAFQMEEAERVRDYNRLQSGTTNLLNEESNHP